MPEFLLVSILIAVLNILLYVLLDRMQRDAAIREEYRLSDVSLAAQETRIAETKEQYAKGKKAGSGNRGKSGGDERAFFHGRKGAVVSRGIF